MHCELSLSVFQAFSWKGTKTTFVAYKSYYNFALDVIYMQSLEHWIRKRSLKRGLGGQLGQPRANHELGASLDETSNINLVPNDILNMNKVLWKTMCTYIPWSHITYTHSKPYK